MSWIILVWQKKQKQDKTERGKYFSQHNECVHLTINLGHFFPVFQGFTHTATALF